jgi:FkbM family methyltransferase
MNLLKIISIYLNLIHKKIISKKYFYSYGGIDSVVNNIFRNQKNGFYVDVGAQHPIKNNNTYLLHKKGWEGVNIDLDQKNINLFNVSRKNDCNICAAISSLEKDANLYYYHEGSPINTLSKEIADRQKAIIKETRTIKTKTLTSILENSKFKNKEIDFLSIDVEGVELEVLQGLNLNIYKPKIIVVELLDLDSKKLEIKNLNINNVINSEIYKYIEKNNYTMINWLHSDIVFVNNKFRD